MSQTQHLPSSHRLVLAIDDVHASMRTAIDAVRDIPGCVLELVGSVPSAQERLSMSRCDVVVMPVDDRADALGLIKRLRSSHVHAFITIVVVLQDWQTGMASTLFDADVDMVVVGSPDRRVLNAQIRQAMKRGERWRRHMAARSPALAGDDSAFTLPDLIGFLASARRTGLLEVTTMDGQQADLVFRNGNLEHALYGNHQADDAVVALMRDYEKARFSFTPNHDASDEIRSTCRIATSVNGLLLDAAREADDARRHGGQISAQPVYAKPPTTIITVCEPAEQPKPYVLVEVGGLLLDDANLAELTFVTKDTMATWSRDAGMIRVIIIAGIEAMPHLLALASPLGPDQLLLALDNKPLALRLGFYSDGHGVDILLVDPARVAEVVEPLPCGPHVVLLAPDGGVWSGYTMSAQRSILAAICTTAPIGLAVCGSPEAARQIESAFSAIGRDDQLVAAIGPIDGSLDVREVVTTGLAGLR
jgi:DNA-binding NarL/FixJ family response regulator